MNLGRPVNPGQKISIPADLMNVLRRMAQDYLAGSATGARGPGPGRGFDVVYVKNVSDTDVAQFGILGIQDILFSPTDNLDGFKDRFAFCGAVPDVDLHTGKFVVCLEPIPCASEGHDAGIGRALLSGIIAAQVAVANSTEEGWSSADVYDGSSSYLKMVIGGGAAQVLWKESGVGIKWAILRLGVPLLPFSIPIESLGVAVQYNDSHVNASEMTVYHLGTSAGGWTYPDTGYNSALIGKFERPFLFRPESKIVVPISDHPGALEYLASVSAPASPGGFGRITFSVSFDLYVLCDDFDGDTINWTDYSAFVLFTNKFLYGRVSAGLQETNTVLAARMLAVDGIQQLPSGLVAAFNATPYVVGKQVYGFALEVFRWDHGLNGNGSNFYSRPHLSADACYAAP